MKFEYAFLADAATMLPNGTFDVIGGGLDFVKGKSFPATKASMVFIARLLLDPEECGIEHTFTGEITDALGRIIYPPFRGSFVPPHARLPNRASPFYVCLNAELVQFPTPGEYAFRLLIGGKAIGEVALEAVLEEKVT